MKINSLTLTNFRNHNTLTYKPKSGLNMIIGENGKGKTNILEAMYFCSFGKSFRTINNEDLINENEHTFYIQLEIEDESKHLLQIECNKHKKTFILDGKKLTKMSELNKRFNVLLFIPSYVDLFKDSPAERRTMLDIMISKINLTYLERLKRYKILLKERNLALKQDEVNKMYVFTLTNEMVAISEEITSIRLAFIKEINEILSKIAYQISNKNQELRIKYEPLVEANDVYREKLLKLYQDSYQKDLILKTTSIGIHKEDFKMYIDDKELSIYGSQGENRLCAISFVLSPYFLKNSHHPVILLDDVLSELDRNNQNRLIEFVSKFDQTFITTTKDFNVGTKYKV